MREHANESRAQHHPGSSGAGTTAPIGAVPPPVFPDHYELAMVAAPLADGTADRRCTFEVFARRLPDGRRYGVGAGTGRLLAAISPVRLGGGGGVAGTAGRLEAIARFRFGEAELERLSGVLGGPMIEWLADYRFSGDIDG